MANTATAKKPKADKPQSLVEITHSSASTKVDREAGVIRGVKIIGLESANGRQYSPKALREARQQYEGLSVNIDHPDKAGGKRGVKDRFGKLENVREQADGLYGDLPYLKSHPLAEMVAEVAERMPEQLGLSHNAEGRVAVRGGKNIVEQITRVRSVDMVSDPATVRGLFENEGYGMDPTMDAGAPAVEPAELSAEEQMKAGIVAAITAKLTEASADQLKKVLDALELSDSASEIVSGSTSSTDTETDTTTEEGKTTVKNPDPTVTQLQEQITKLTAENESLQLLESAGVKSEPAKLKALVALPTKEDRVALVATWPIAAVTPAPKSGPRSTLLESRQTPASPTSEEFEKFRDGKTYAQRLRNAS